MVADLPVNEIHAAWLFPDGDDLPDRVEPAVLLPHDPPKPPIAFVDFDDVRDPETGTVPGEVNALISMLGGYTELSRSEQGVYSHVVLDSLLYTDARPFFPIAWNPFLLDGVKYTPVYGGRAIAGVLGLSVLIE
jgi:hypothetical protein